MTRFWKQDVLHYEGAASTHPTLHNPAITNPLDPARMLRSYTGEARCWQALHDMVWYSMRAERGRVTPGLRVWQAPL